MAKKDRIETNQFRIISSESTLNRNAAHTGGSGRAQWLPR
jgi:hypothetical protein